MGRVVGGTVLVVGDRELALWPEVLGRLLMVLRCDDVVRVSP